MKKIPFFLLMVLLFSVWLGCASVGKDFDSEKTRQNQVLNDLREKLNTFRTMLEEISNGIGIIKVNWL